MTNPFPSTTTTPGQGTIELRHVPPHSSSLSQVSYQYPLKLVAPAPLRSEDGISVQTVYLLTYGGGLVAGDTIDLHVNLDPSTRLILLTQGSTKLFKSPSADIVSSQGTVATLKPGSALAYLPDPVQPFARSAFTQHQAYRVHAGGSLAALDWVSRGRPARGEDWGMWSYQSRNDIFAISEGGKERLLLRDNLVLRPDPEAEGETEADPSFARQMHGVGVYGTLILHGPVVEGLAKWFHAEFKAIPRIGGRKWDTEEDTAVSDDEARRVAQRRVEAADGLIWTVATHRDCTVVKFGSHEVEGSKKWLRAMLEKEGSIGRHFGERALLCLRQ